MSIGRFVIDFWLSLIGIKAPFSGEKRAQQSAKKLAVFFKREPFGGHLRCWAGSKSQIIRYWVVPPSEHHFNENPVCGLNTACELKCYKNRYLTAFWFAENRKNGGVAVFMPQPRRLNPHTACELIFEKVFCSAKNPPVVMANCYFNLNNLINRYCNYNWLVLQFTMYKCMGEGGVWFAW